MPFKECRSWDRQVPYPKHLLGATSPARATNVNGRFDLCYRHHRLGQVDLAQPVT